MPAARFRGPRPPSALPTDPNEILGEFAAAQRCANGSLPDWCDHKGHRKEKWRSLGVPE